MTVWTENKIKKYRKEGRGQGEGEEYSSWIQSQDLPKNYKESYVVKPYSWKNRRVHYIFTDLVLHYFYMMEWDDEIIDIRENFPLELNRTVEIAKSHKITHIKCPKNKIPIVMTNTFLITKVTDGEKILEAIDVEFSTKLQSKRAQNQLNIKKLYWEQKGIVHRVITEKDINSVLSQNVYSLYSFRKADGEINESLCYRILEELKKYKQELNKIEFEEQDRQANFMDRILKERRFDVRIYEFNEALSKELNLTPGDIYTHIFFMIANKIIGYDMENREMQFGSLKVRDLLLNTSMKFKILLNEYDVGFGIKHKYNGVLKTN